MNATRIDALPRRFVVEAGRIVVDGASLDVRATAGRAAGRATKRANDTRAVDADADADDADVLLDALADAVYRDAYARLPLPVAASATMPSATALAVTSSPVATPPVTTPSAAERVRDDDFADRVIAAHGTAERWDAGWRLDALGPGGHVSVARDADWRHAAPGDFRTDPAGRGAVPGARVALLVRPFDLESQTGSLYLHGDVLDDRASGAWLGRLYFNADPETTVRLVATVGRALDRRRVPFTLKCPAHAWLCARLDSVVLYVGVRHLDAVLDLLGRELADAGSPLHALADETPLFTRELAPGIGFAEDPGAGHSFGTHRSRLVAEALIAHAASGPAANPEGAWRASLDAAFAAVGLDPARPWLAPGSIDRLSLEPVLERAGGAFSENARTGSASEGSPRRGDAASSAPSSVRSNGEVEGASADVDGAKSPLDGLAAKCRAEASRIAMTLCRDAIWADGGCGWMSWELSGDGERLVERYAAAGASLYDGGAGIALFLAHVARHDDEPLIADTLEGALRGLAPRVDRLRAAGDGGAYTGLAGVAFALREIAALQGDAALAHEAEALLDEAVPFVAADGASIDVLSGLAGVLPLLLERGHAAALARARQLAENLLARARPTAAGLEWPTGHGAGATPLTGFSHGAAGIAWSLAEVGAATGSATLVEAARATMRVENAGFSNALGNWLDFRDADTGGGTGGGPGDGTGGDANAAAPSAMSAWCHGAPGIGLARLRTASLLDDEASRTDARVALEHVVGTLTHDPRALPHGLCHGLCGNLEPLLEASRLDGGARWRAPLDATLEALLDAVALGHPWRGCARSGRQTPGLMLGLAGIGHFLLRRADPRNGPRPVLLMPPEPRPPDARPVARHRRAPAGASRTL